MDLLEPAETSIQVDFINTDIRKALDSVNHNILILKLNAIEISGNFLKWFRSYLTTCFQQVLVNGYFSFKFPVTFGVSLHLTSIPMVILIIFN
jgi:hypothetical protein